MLSSIYQSINYRQYPVSQISNDDDPISVKRVTVEEVNTVAQNKKIAKKSCCAKFCCIFNWFGKSQANENNSQDGLDENRV